MIAALYTIAFNRVLNILVIMNQREISVEYVKNIFNQRKIEQLKDVPTFCEFCSDCKQRKQQQNLKKLERCSFRYRGGGGIATSWSYEKKNAPKKKMPPLSKISQPGEK